MCVTVFVSINDSKGDFVYTCDRFCVCVCVSPGVVSVCDTGGRSCHCVCGESVPVCV